MYFACPLQPKPKPGYGCSINNSYNNLIKAWWSAPPNGRTAILHSLNTQTRIRVYITSFQGPETTQGNKRNTAEKGKGSGCSRERIAFKSYDTLKCQWQFGCVATSRRSKQRGNNVLKNYAALYCMSLFTYNGSWKTMGGNRVKWDSRPWDGLDSILPHSSILEMAPVAGLWFHISYSGPPSSQGTVLGDLLLILI